MRVVAFHQMAFDHYNEWAMTDKSVRTLAPPHLRSFKDTIRWYWQA